MPLNKKEPEVAIEANPDQDPMIPIAELDHIRRCAYSVALLEVPRYRNGKEAEKPFTGTGWLIAPGLILTCWHVIAATREADEPPPAPYELRWQVQHTLVSFGHVEIGKGGPQYGVSLLEYSSSETSQLDFALLRLKNREDQSFTQFSYLPFELDTPEAGRIHLAIIHHPQAKPQFFSAGRFKGLSSTPSHILYTTATAGGTSGAPVINRYNWHVVALHNAEHRQAQLRTGTRIKYILSELETKRPDLHAEIVSAQANLTNALPSVSLTHPLPLSTSLSNRTLQSAFSLVHAQDQKTPVYSYQSGLSDNLPEYACCYTYQISSLISCLAFHPTGSYLAAGAERDSLHILNMPHTKDAIYSVKTYMKEVTSLAFSSDGKYLALGDNDGAIALWDSSQLKKIRSFQGHNDWVSSLSFSSKGQYLISSSPDSCIKIWEVRHGTLVSSWRDQTGISRLALHPLDEMIAGAALGQSLKLHSFPPHELLPLPTKLSGVWSLLFSLGGHYLVAGDTQGVISVFETTSWKVLHRFTSSDRKIRCLAFHPDSRFLASGGDDQVIQLWDVVRGKNIQTLVRHTDRIESLTFSPDGQYIASGGKDARIILWKRR